jgi:DNA-binding NarL/FixJ family response regulator
VIQRFRAHVSAIAGASMTHGMQNARSPKGRSKDETPYPSASSGRGDIFLSVIVDRLVRIGTLTPRMAEAVDLHVRGWPPEAAAREMRCAHNTYRNHLAVAFRRVGAESASELLRIVANDLDWHPVEMEFEPCARIEADG